MRRAECVVELARYILGGSALNPRIQCPQVAICGGGFWNQA